MKLANDWAIKRGYKVTGTPVLTIFLPIKVEQGFSAPAEITPGGVIVKYNAINHEKPLILKLVHSNGTLILKKKKIYNNPTIFYRELVIKVF